MSNRIAAFGKPKDLEAEVTQLRLAVEEIQKSLFTETHVVPAKPREGMLRWADGTDWNPGAGAGLYHYLGGVWNKL